MKITDVLMLILHLLCRSVEPHLSRLMLMNMSVDGAERKQPFRQFLSFKTWTGCQYFVSVELQAKVS